VPGPLFLRSPARRPPDRNADGRIGALAVGFAAVAHANDFNGVVALIAVDESPGADPVAQQRRVEAFELFYVADAGFQKSVEGFEKPEGCVAVDGADIGTGLGGPDDLLGHSC
jgi:hypothetical protein